ncbi:MAG: hypothetical protein HY283_11380 [Nitrospirae bacterium]|nr:hypothetical protein [Nitrospirota bacterium]
MTPRHIYDAEGFWVAFVVGTDVFLRGGEWLGRLSGEKETGEKEAGTNEIRDRDGHLRGLMDERGRMSLVEAAPFRITVSESIPLLEAERDAEKVG